LIKKSSVSKKRNKEDKAQKKVQALRDNLRKRKQQVKDSKNIGKNISS
tara:strand:- start:327 stop:470 length:144 start_codon:yes stop_codon:yes gene_type:complete